MEGRSGASIFEDSPVETKPNILLETSNKSTRSSRSAIVRPNRNKDLPSSGSTRGFWGGHTLGGTTPVHTTLIPDFDISTIAGKPRPLQENMNPLLNSTPAMDENQTQSSLAPYLPLLSSGLDGLHNFTLKGLDNDRMQLWSRMAREAGAAQAARDKQLGSPASSTHSSLGSSNGYSSSLSQSNVSPLFFSSPSLQLIKKEATKAVTPTLSQAALATTLSTTVSSKLMGALWSAFAPKSTLDIDKVKKVLEGKAELRVVDVEHSSAAVLEESLKAMTLGSVTPPAASSSKKSSVELLEEGLKGMSLSPAMAARNECAAAAASAACGSLGIFGRPMRAGHTPSPAHQPTSKHTVTAQH
jgi:bZIP-type transcription factor MBZ1